MEKFHRNNHRVTFNATFKGSKETLQITSSYLHNNLNLQTEIIIEINFRLTF